MVFFAGKSPSVRPYTGDIYGPGQPYVLGNLQGPAVCIYGCVCLCVLQVWVCVCVAGVSVCVCVCLCAWQKQECARRGTISCSTEELGRLLHILKERTWILVCMAKWHRGNGEAATHTEGEDVDPCVHGKMAQRKWKDCYTYWKRGRGSLCAWQNGTEEMGRLLHILKERTWIFVCMAKWYRGNEKAATHAEGEDVDPCVHGKMILMCKEEPFAATQRFLQQATCFLQQGRQSLE